MTDVKARDLSHEKWCALLEPYGWATITTRSLITPRGVSLGVAEYEFRVMLKADDNERDEWVQRSNLLDQARRAVKAVQAKGYIFMDAPRIEFGGQYKYRVDRGAVPEWHAEAEMSFRVHAT